MRVYKGDKTAVEGCFKLERFRIRGIMLILGKLNK